MYYVCMFICVCVLKSALFGSWRGNPDGDSCNDEADYQRRSMPPIQPTFQLMIFPFIVCYMSIKQINTYYIYNVSILCAYIYMCVCISIFHYFHLFPPNSHDISQMFWRGFTLQVAPLEPRWASLKHGWEIRVKHVRELNRLLLKMAIEIVDLPWFTCEKWGVWIMLVYQRLVDLNGRLSVASLPPSCGNVGSSTHLNQ